MSKTDVTDHLPAKTTPELFQFIDEVALVKSRYLFTKRIKAKQFSAYCTHCDTESIIDHAIKHNEKTTCPSCSSEVVSKQAGRGRGTMVDHAYVEFASKSLVDPNIVTIAGYYVMRDFREHYMCVDTSIMLSTIYTFSPGDAHMYAKSRKEPIFVECNRIHALHKGTGMYDLPAYFCYESLDKAIEGTPFQYSQASEYNRALIPAYLALFCKYPYIEAIDKIGLSEVIIDRLYGRATKVFNWRGKTLDSIIGLPKRDWKHFRNVESPLSQENLRNFKQLRDYDKTSHASELIVFAQEYSVYRLISVLRRTNTKPQKAYRYIHKVMKRDPENFRRIADVLSTWDDFIEKLAQDGIDVQNDDNIYPADLHEMHQRQIERARAVADEKNNEAVTKRYEELEYLSFANEEFFLRPVNSPKELANEGNTLKHCVGSYLKRHVDGGTNIFVLRKVTEPDTPFYTVEIARDAVQQVRGYRNAVAPKEVESFMEQFKETMLNATQQEIRKAS